MRRKHVETGREADVGTRDATPQGPSLGLHAALRARLFSVNNEAPRGSLIRSQYYFFAVEANCAESPICRGFGERKLEVNMVCGTLADTPRRGQPWGGEGRGEKARKEGGLN